MTSEDDTRSSWREANKELENDDTVRNTGSEKSVGSKTSKRKTSKAGLARRSDSTDSGPEDYDDGGNDPDRRDILKWGAAGIATVLGGTYTAAEATDCDGRNIDWSREECSADPGVGPGPVGGNETDTADGRDTADGGGSPDEDSSDPSESKTWVEENHDSDYNGDAYDFVLVRSQTVAGDDRWMDHFSKEVQEEGIDLDEVADGTAEGYLTDQIADEDEEVIRDIYESIPDEEIPEGTYFVFQPSNDTLGTSQVHITDYETPGETGDHQVAVDAALLNYTFDLDNSGLDPIKVRDPAN